MLSFEQIKELLELVSERGLDGLEVERAGFRLKVQGQRQEVVTVAATPAIVEAPAPTLPVPAAAAATPAAPTEVPAAEDGAGEGGLPDGAHVVNSPIVGTYYGAPSPDADPYVRSGDRVKKGQVLCIVEAMKLMNEIESDIDGVVLEIYPKNEQPVEYGEPLFAVQPD